MLLRAVVIVMIIIVIAWMIGGLMKDRTRR
jgi:hypothetical protein